MRFLDRTVEEHGMGYKDVVQPFVTASWLERKELAVLKITRTLSDVAFAMQARAWTYPGRVATPGAENLHAVIEGLARATAAQARLPGVTVTFESMIWDENALRRALCQLYPGVLLPYCRYIDESFKRTRERILSYRSTSEYQAVVSAINAMNIESTGHDA